MSPRGLSVALVSGAALSFAFPEPDLAPIAWVAVAPLLVLLRDASARAGLLYGFVFGVGFFGVLLVWISHVGWVAWAILVVLQASFAGLFGAAAAVLLRRFRSPLATVAVPAVAWVGIVEYLRAIVPLGGFTWGQLAQGQSALTWMLKAAGLAGGWLITLIVLLVNGLLALAWERQRRGRPVAAIVAGALAMVLLAAPAALPEPARAGDPVDVAIVQGNVPRDFAGTFYDKELAITRSHRRLTEQLARGERVPDLVIWPESSVGLDITRDVIAAQEVEAAAVSLGRPMIVGGNIDLDDERYEVVAFEVSPEGDITDIYRKTHLVPFGEYVPGRRFLQWIPLLDQIPRDAVARRERTLFDLAGGTVATVLSFEGDFGPLVHERVAAGGRLVVVATNTSTWGESWASAQHLAFSKVRAAENGVWVVHAALSGISGFVAPDGTVTASLPLWTAGTLVEQVSFAARVTPYARMGDWLAQGCLTASVLILLLALAGVPYFSRRNHGRNPPEGRLRDGNA